MRAIVASCVLVVCTFGMVVADEFLCTITKIETKDGKTIISGKKGKKDEAKEFTFTLAKDAKVNKGSKKKGDTTYTVGDAIDGGLKSDMFKDVSAEKGKGVTAFVTTDAKDSVTSLLVIQKAPGKKKKDTN